MPRKLIHVRWTSETDDLLRRLWAKPLTVAAIGRRMRRHPGTIQAKAASLGLPRREPSATFAQTEAPSEADKHSLAIDPDRGRSHR